MNLFSSCQCLHRRMHRLASHLRVLVLPLVDTWRGTIVLHQRVSDRSQIVHRLLHPGSCKQSSGDRWCFRNLQYTAVRDKCRITSGVQYTTVTTLNNLKILFMGWDWTHSMHSGLFEYSWSIFKPDIRSHLTCDQESCQYDGHSSLLHGLSLAGLLCRGQYWGSMGTWGSDTETQDTTRCCCPSSPHVALQYSHGDASHDTRQLMWHEGVQWINNFQ